MKLTKKDKMTPLEKEIANVCSTLYNTSPDSDDYRKIVENLERLVNAQAKLPQKKTLSPDTILTVAGSLAGILLILTYEHSNVITSKALSFVLRGRA